MLSKTQLLLICVLLSGCTGIVPPYNLTEVAFIRVYNETEFNFKYQAHMFSEWTEIIPVEPGKIDFLFEYDRKSKTEMLPDKLHQIKIYFSNCLLALNRQQLQLNMVQPVDKSAGWNLYVTDELIKKIGCRK